MKLADIDFAQLYRDHMFESGGGKPSDEWDRRSADRSRTTVGGAYTEAFIAGMDLSGARTLLDVGCGHGTLCLPLADRFEQIYALDFSQGMLNRLEDNAKKLAVRNAQTIRRAWEDDWSDIPVADILIASRSSAVGDMAALIDKINSHARLRAYVTQLVGGRFIDPQIAALLGRRQTVYPDYIYTINLLYQRGIHPRLHYIETPSRFSTIEDFPGFASKVAWALGDLNEDESRRLYDWYQADPDRARGAGNPMRWAFIGWDIPPMSAA